MSEDEEYEDLPSISVLSSVRDASAAAMPSASEVREQRLREAQCQRQLAAPAHSDSSSSEGEAWLAASVSTLRVLPPPRRAAPSLRAALAQRRPEDPLLRVAPAPALHRAVTDNVCAAIACSANTWSTEEALSAAVWLCCELEAGAAAGAGRGGRTRRALQWLLDGGGAGAADELAALLAGAAPPAQLLRLGDALRSGAGGGADRAAGALVRAALAAGGAGGAAADRYTAVQAAGRLLAAGAGDAEVEAHAQVERASAGLDRHRPDHLKVLVAGSKLQLLFRA